MWLQMGLVLPSRFFGLLEALIHQLSTEPEWMTLVAHKVRFPRYTTGGQIDDFKSMGGNSSKYSKGESD